MKKKFIHSIVVVVIIFTQLFSQKPMPVRRYDLGDWLTIKNCNYVTSVSESHNYIFFGTLGGIIPYEKFNDYEEPAYTTSDGLADDEISAVFFDNATSYLWAAHRRGLSFLSPVADRWETPYRFKNKDQKIENIGSNNKNILLQTNHGLVILDNQTGKPMKINGEINADDTYWSTVIGEGPIPLEGIYNIDDGFILQPDGVVKDHEFREYDLNLMYVNSQKDIYGGIFGLGYLTGCDNLKMVSVHSSGLLKNYVNAIALSDKFMWIGGMDDSRMNEIDRTGISQYDFVNQQWKYYEDFSIHGLASGKIYDISYSNNKLAVATLEGVSVYDLKENKWRRYSTFDGLWDNEVKCLLVENDMVLAGSEFGLNEINLKNSEIKRIYLTDTETLIKIFKIENSQNNYWIGTNNGIYAINKKDNSVKHFDFYGREIKNGKKIAFNCYAITSDENNVIFKGDNFFMHYNSEKNEWKNLPDYDREAGVHDMDLFGQYLWIGTDKGARFMNVETQEWEKYGYVDGLGGERVFKVLIDGDWVWFGTDNGLTKYNWRKYVLE